MPVSDDVVLAILGVLNVALLVYLERIRRHARRASTNSYAARTQVENNHDTNLREEGDERHKEVINRLDKQDKLLEKQDRLLEGLSSSDVRQWHEINRLRRRWPWR